MNTLWMIFGDSFQITKSKYCLFSFKCKADVSENVLDIPKVSTHTSNRYLDSMNLNCDILFS